MTARPDFSELDAGPADDAEFVRRVYLDLAGCVPSAEATRAFLADERPTATKREELIDGIEEGGVAMYIDRVGENANLFI